MTVGGDDEDRMIKMSPYTDRILRHCAFNGQIEDSDLTEENETEQQKGDSEACGLDEIHGKREESFLFMSL